MPYRENKQPRPKQRARSAPVLDELVKQFSDRYAFLRELVQNAIDAGATRVRVGVMRDGDDRVTYVEDNGSGMTLDVIKGPFLTKFSSSKDGDSSKIGRYGVGFLSVFALAPRLVVVDTEVADAAYAISLEPTFDYRVATRGKLERMGTRISILESLATLTVQDDAHLAAVEQALLRWCRYANIEIELEVAGEARSLRRTFGLVAPVTIEIEEDGMRILVGPSVGTDMLPALAPDEPTGDSAGFYSRGLTLIEATGGEHVIKGLRYRVECADFAHTISRDDVLRNAAYRHAIERVAELGAAPLRKALAEALRTVATRSSVTRLIDARLPALLWAGQELLRDDQVVVPLLEPAGEVIAAVEVIARARVASPITAELGKRRGARIAYDPSGAAPWLSSSIPSAENLLSMVEIRFAPEDDRFCQHLRAVLASIGLDVEHVLLADATDADGHVARLVHHSELRRVEEQKLALFFPRGSERNGDQYLLLFTGHAALRALRKRPATEHAAVLGARLVWLELSGELSHRKNLTLLEASQAAWGAVK